MAHRYQMCSHNGVDCLHVMTEANELIAHAYIPLDDILEQAVAKGYMTQPSQEEQLKAACEAISKVQIEQGVRLHPNAMLRIAMQEVK